MAELVDALGLGSSVFMTWRFKSSQRHFGGSMINVYDDWLQPELKNILRDTFLSSNLPWYLPSTKWYTVPQSVADNFSEDDRVITSPQMVHPVIIEGWEQHTGGHEALLMYFIRSFFEQISQDRDLDVYIHRMKANLMHRQICEKPLFFNPPHIDHVGAAPDGRFAAVCLYYVDDSDGDTFFFDEDWDIIQRVTPKAGRMVLFRNDLYHASSPPQKNEGRIVLNTNIFLPNEAGCLV